MTIKSLVNDYAMHEALMKELEERLLAEHKALSIEVEPYQIYRRQGAILALNKLKRIREDVNGRK